MGALSDISIKLDGIGHVLCDCNFAVPPNQRSYAWRDEHVQDLFRDLGTAIADGQKEYFLGSIVVTRTDTERLEVADGQQRLATTTILLAAIRDYFFDEGDVELARDVEAKFLVTRDLRSREQMPRLYLNEIDHDFFHKRILASPDNPARKVISSKPSHNLLDAAAKQAREHVRAVVSVTNKPTDVLLDWIEYVEKQAKVILVQVPDDVNAFTIFETLNDRGLDLAKSDLIKNSLFAAAQNRLEEVRNRWTAMAGALEAVSGEDMTVTFIRHLWSSKHGAIREKDLHPSIKSRVKSKQAAVDFASDLETNARLYAAILYPEHEVWMRYGPTTSEHARILKELGMVQMRPLLLAILDTLSESEVKKSISLLVSWAVRLLIFGGLGGGTLETYYCQRAQEVREGSIRSVQGLMEAAHGVIPSDGPFEAAFAVASVTKTNLARYYLRTLEMCVESRASGEVIPNSNQQVVTLEHILPQTISPAWPHIDPETARTYCDRIGNLTLLGHRPNSSAGNDGFAAKRTYYANSSFVLTSNLAKYHHWGPNEIEERQAELAKLALRAWPLKIH